MLNLKRILATAAGVFALAYGPPASAALISAGSPVVFNFSGPAGPFTRIVFFFGIEDCTVLDRCERPAETDAGSITAFDGLDGSGSSSALMSWRPDDIGDPQFSFNPNGTFAADGRFSLVYSAAVGSIQASPFVTFEDASGALTRVDGVTVASVPEPGTLLLVAGALLAAATRRRRAA